MKSRSIPSDKTLAKQARRAQKEADVGKKIRALPARRFGLIYTDPAWRFEVYSRVTGLDRDASNHYPVMALADIKALPVASLAAPDSVLALWTTAPMMPQALEVMAAWGFAYKAQAVWVKDRVRLGFWFRGKHELLLVGTRGDIPAPAPGTQFPFREHSRKPDEAYEILERYFPTVPRVELFARPETGRPGWEYWGPDVPLLAMGEPKRPELPDRARVIEAELADRALEAREAARLRKLAFNQTTADATKVETLEQPGTATVVEFPMCTSLGVADEFGAGGED